MLQTLNNKLLHKHRSAPRFSPSLLSNLDSQVDFCSNLFLFSLDSFVSNEPPLESASAITHKHTFNQTRVMQMSCSNYSDAQTLSSDLTLKNSLANFFFLLFACFTTQSHLWPAVSHEEGKPDEGRRKSRGREETRKSACFSACFYGDS